ncbi:hypothetical protein ANCCAN_01150 [Ancylostoma caninum]|uniref:Uncharacterized protein n=1 Tax=Ancylostoma caninum TaxID=29170 RepID=A0A368H840_ANCCA|nr:hypothetical protein ANCCAN_01150 [Ancylostoma caninum]
MVMFLWIHPTLSKHEQDIDALLEQAKSESYNQLVRLGSRSLLCARDIVAEAALRGQAQLVNQLQRSYSANDVNREREEDSRKRIHVEGIEELEDETSDHERSGEQQADGDEMPRRRANRSRSRSRPLEGGENTYNTMPRRSTRRHM